MFSHRLADGTPSGRIGLRIVGINLDPLQDGGRRLEAILPNVRRFLLDHNVPWPILVDGAGDAAYARGAEERG